MNPPSALKMEHSDGSKWNHTGLYATSAFPRIMKGTYLEDQGAEGRKIKEETEQGGDNERRMHGRHGGRVGTLTCFHKVLYHSFLFLLVF